MFKKPSLLLSLLFPLLLPLLAASSPAVVPRSPSMAHALTKSYRSTNGHSIAKADQARAAQFGEQESKSVFIGERGEAPGPASISNQVVLYAALVTVGDVHNVSLLIDTGSSATGCTKQKCDAENKTGQTEVLLYGSAQFVGQETIQRVSLGPYKVENQSVAVADFDNGLSSFDGILGIGPTALNKDGRPLNKSAVLTFTDNMVREKQIPRNVVTLYYAPTVEGGEENGEIKFGSVDDSRCVGALTYIPMTTTKPSNAFWGINIDSVTYANATLQTRTAGIVDSGTTLILLKTDAFNAYKKATGASLDPTTGLLSLPASSYGQLETLVFNIDGFTLRLVPDAQIWPRNLNNCIGGNDDKIYLIVGDLGQSGAPGLEFILGYTLLERFYSVYDADKRQIGLCPTTHAYMITNNKPATGNNTFCSESQVQISNPPRIGSKELSNITSMLPSGFTQA